MAALLVALGVMAVLMSVAMPVWRHQAQREKEAELVFRGEQYARAIYLYRRKNGGTSPANIDLLVEQRYLRKKYKDPMTPDGEFQIIPMGGIPQAGPGGPTGRAGSVGSGGRGGGPQPGTVVVAGGQARFSVSGQARFSVSGPGQLVAGGIQGVVSKSPQASIRIYRGAAYYNQWQFLPPVQQQPGGPGQETPGMGRGRGGRGGPGGPGTGGGRGPGGRGVGPGGRGTLPRGPGRGSGSSPFPMRPPGGRGLSH